MAEKNAEIARNRYASIQSKVETQQSEIECLKKQLEDLKAQNEELSRAIPEREEAEKIDLPEEPKIDYVGCLTLVYPVAPKILQHRAAGNIMLGSYLADNLIAVGLIIDTSIL